MAHRTYLICAGPRTGSNLLATALRATTVAGRPFEYFNGAAINKPWMLRLLALPAGEADARLADRLPLILTTGSSANGVFGATIHWWDLDGLVQAIREARPPAEPVPAQPLEVLQSFFPGLRFIWLRRDNTVAQGISHYLARATGVWSVLRRSPAEQLDKAAVPFDFARIDKLVRDAELQTRHWRALFAGADEHVLELTYEKLTADFSGTLHRVLAFLGQPLPPTLPPPNYLRQADARSAEWEELYRRQAAGTRSA